MSTSEFSYPIAHLRLFGSKQSYLAFKAAWKALTNTGASLAPCLYAARALLTGRDLYRGFSPNRHAHVRAPYQALAVALASLARMDDASSLARGAFASSIGPEHSAALVDSLRTARDLARTLKLGSGLRWLEVAEGRGRFACAVDASAGEA
jgi:hypothetical protein